jgi:hypothetical protein
VLAPSFVRIDASHFDNWRSVFQSAKEVLGTSSGILGIRRLEQDGFLGALQSQTKTENKAISSELLAYFETEGEIFLSPTVTANETWAISRHHPQPHQKKVSRKSQRARKLMITVFWDCEGVTLLDSIPRGETINSDTYIRTLTKLWKHFKRVHALYDPTEILLQHDNAIPHTSLKT